MCLVGWSGSLFSARKRGVGGWDILVGRGTWCSDHMHGSRQRLLSGVGLSEARVNSEASKERGARGWTGEGPPVTKGRYFAIGKSLVCRLNFSTIFYGAHNSSARGNGGS
ncbi:unnamed protein product [Ectocarpus sp. 8 AP-2014]